MTTKVKSTVSHKTSQGEVIVTKGELVLIKTDNPNNHNVYVNSIGYQSIIISKTDRPSFGNDIVLDCMVYDSHYKVIRNYNVGVSGYKILVMPENFTPRQLDAIVNGKMTDGDEIYVECEKYSEDLVIGKEYLLDKENWLIKITEETAIYLRDLKVKDSDEVLADILINVDEDTRITTSKECLILGKRVKLNKFNHVTLHKIERKDIREDEMHLNMQYYMEYCKNNEYVTPMEWIKKHKHF